MEKRYSECVQIGNKALSLQDLGFSTYGSYILEVNHFLDASGDFVTQRLSIDRAGLLAIYRLIEPLVERLEEEEKPRYYDPKTLTTSPNPPK